MDRPEGNAQLEKPRPLTTAEKRLLDQMLAEPFKGRDRLCKQLEAARVVGHGPVDTRTILFAVPSDDELQAHVIQRVPVDASMSDLDGTNIDLLLHVVDGYAHELEAYRVDGGPIERAELDGPLKLVNRYPQSFD